MAALAALEPSAQSLRRMPCGGQCCCLIQHSIEFSIHTLFSSVWEGEACAKILWAHVSTSCIQYALCPTLAHNSHRLPSCLAATGLQVKSHVCASNPTSKICLKDSGK